MRRFRDPNGAIERPEPRLPLSEKVLCALTVLAILASVAAAIFGRWRG